MDITKLKSGITPAATPGRIEALDLQFYLGQDMAKIKAVDTKAGINVTVAYLCATNPDNPKWSAAKRELVLDFAALACQSKALLDATRSLVMLSKMMTLPEEIQASIPVYEAAISKARREETTEGVISPDILEAIKKQVGEE